MCRQDDRQEGEEDGNAKKTEKDQRQRNAAENGAGDKDG